MFFIEKIIFLKRKNCFSNLLMLNSIVNSINLIISFLLKLINHWVICDDELWCYFFNDKINGIIKTIKGKKKFRINLKLQFQLANQINLCINKANHKVSLVFVWLSNLITIESQWDSLTWHGNPMMRHNSNANIWNKYLNQKLSGPKLKRYFSSPKVISTPIFMSTFSFSFN